MPIKLRTVVPKYIGQCRVYGHDPYDSHDKWLKTFDNIGSVSIIMPHM